MKPVSSLDITREAFRAYARHAGVLLTASLMINAAALFVTVFALNTFGVSGLGVYRLSWLVSGQIATASATLLIARLWTDGAPTSAMELLKPALARAIAVCVLAWLYFVCVAMCSMLLLLPGLYVATRFSLAFPALLIRRVGIREACNVSSELTSQAMWPTLRLVVLMNVSTFVLQYVLTSAEGSMAPLEVEIIGSFLINAVVAPLPGLAFGELYLRLASDAMPRTIDHAPTAAWGEVPQPVAAHGMPAGPYGPAAGGYAGAPGFAAAPGFAPVTAFGMPAQPQAPYGAPQPYGAPAQHQPYSAPAQTQPAYGAPSASETYGAPQPYGAPHAQPYATPAPAPVPAPAPAAPNPQPYGAAPSAPAGGPVPGPVHPGREHSIAPPGY